MQAISTVHNVLLSATERYDSQYNVMLTHVGLVPPIVLSRSDLSERAAYQ